MTDLLRFQQKNNLDDLIYISGQSEFLKLEGLISTPGHEKATSSALKFFVNSRYVKDKAVRYGVMRGYHSHLLRGRYPSVLLYLRMDPTLVDVNVHPAKLEVRFQYNQEVQSFIAQTIRTALRKGEWTRDADSSVMSVLNSDDTAVDSKTQEALSQDCSDQQKNSSRSSFAHRTDKTSLWAKDKKTGDRNYPHADLLSKSDEGPRQAPSQTSSALEQEKPKPTNFSQARKLDWSIANYLGSFDRCYLLFEVDHSLLVVDQHAFHERILYERLMSDPSLLSTREASVSS